MVSFVTYRCFHVYQRDEQTHSPIVPNRLILASLLFAATRRLWSEILSFRSVAYILQKGDRSLPFAMVNRTPGPADLRRLPSAPASSRRHGKRIAR
jgi:hypothetical protein